MLHLISSINIKLIDMEILKRKEQIELIGSRFEAGRKSDDLLGKIIYIGGIPVLDDLIEKKGIKILTTDLLVRVRGLGVYIGHDFTCKRVSILNENINYWSLEAKNDIKAHKSKSIIGRALLGGILLGPAGAVVGGITGVGDKSVNVSGIDNVLSISINENGNEIMALFSCKNKDVKKTYEFMEKNLPEYYKSPEEVRKLNEPKQFSVADELIKLKELLEEGILTKDEFDKQKAKLLKI